MIHALIPYKVFKKAIIIMPIKGLRNYFTVTEIELTILWGFKGVWGRSYLAFYFNFLITGHRLYIYLGFRHFRALK